MSSSEPEPVGNSSRKVERLACVSNDEMKAISIASELERDVGRMIAIVLDDVRQNLFDANLKAVHLVSRGAGTLWRPHRAIGQPHRRCPGRATRKRLGRSLRHHILMRECHPVSLAEPQSTCAGEGARNVRAISNAVEPRARKCFFRRSGCRLARTNFPPCFDVAFAPVTSVRIREMPGSRRPTCQRRSWV